MCMCVVVCVLALSIACVCYGSCFVVCYLFSFWLSLLCFETTKKQTTSKHTNKACLSMCVRGVGCVLLLLLFVVGGVCVFVCVFFVFCCCLRCVLCVLVFACVCVLLCVCVLAFWGGCLFRSNKQQNKRSKTPFLSLFFVVVLCSLLFYVRVCLVVCY